MTGPDRIANILKAYTEVSRISGRSRATAAQIEDVVQISSEGLRKSKEFLSKPPDESYSEKNAPTSRHAGDHLEILNLSSNASMDRIHRAYLSAIKQYHPDNFSDFSPEFKKLAEEKSKQIILAYEKLTKISR